MTQLEQILTQRIMLLDGGMGTMIQKFNLEENDFRNGHFENHPINLKGCNDVLPLTRKDVIANIHEQYLKAGSDIITTCTFNANAISLADYQLSDYVYDINKGAAELAHSVAERFTHETPDKPRFVSGSIGPTSKTSSIAIDVEDPGKREISFDELVEAYSTQIEGLIDGGVDILQLETFFDVLNAKAALFAAEEVFKKKGMRLPIIVSGTLSDQSGRMLSGQTVEAFYTSIAHANPLAVSLNCGLGAQQLMPFVERLSNIAETRICVYPNAGLPNISCGYDQTPDLFAADLKEYMQRGLVNLVGGCCGTTPIFIEKLAAVVKDFSPRPLPEKKHETRLSGLEPLTIKPEFNFINIGERTNVAGSAKFAKLIREGLYDEALSVARAQVEAGAQMIDVCMDAALIDGPQAMHRFISLMTSDPEIIRVPIMLDSSSWETLETGLKLVQGKCIVNSISLKEGEEVFVQRAMKVHQYGAAVVVMLFDEKGQADTYERKITLAQRAYTLLTEAGFPAEDIVMDPNILAVATGMEEHDKYAKDFIDAVAWIKANLPFAKTSGGVSNLSFAFRGNNVVREAMHSAFLYHAIKAGMDMAIVNAQGMKVYSDIEPNLLERVEDVVLCRRKDATERLIELASELKNAVQTQTTVSVDAWRNDTLENRLSYAMQHGVTEYIESDIIEAHNAGLSALQIIDTMLMPGMEKVGQLFGQGKMFLPQVVKSARVMKSAVAVLTPFMNTGDEQQKLGTIVLATVKGDVHDIGKNIVSVVLTCNGYEVIDLGVMVEPQVIIETAIERKADAICLSGLITPSLEEMKVVCQEAERKGLTIPILVGGATTSALHTAVMMAPHYSGIVAHADNASSDPKLLNDFLGRNAIVAKAKHLHEQQLQREAYENRKVQPLVSLEEARADRQFTDVNSVVAPRIKTPQTFIDVDIARVEPYINWSMLFNEWGLAGHYPEILSDPIKGTEAQRLYDDAQNLLQTIKADHLLKLQAVVGIFDAYRDGDDICLIDKAGNEHTLPMLRNQTAGVAHRCLADYVATENDYLCCFALTAGIGLKDLFEYYKSENDDYMAFMAKFLTDRLTEAFAEYIHLYVRRNMWGFEKDITSDIEHYEGSRLAFGYPATPDHNLKRQVFELLGVEEKTEMRLMESNMIVPEEAECGLIFRNAKPFAIGKIDEEQLKDYARRSQMTIEEAKVMLVKNL